MEKKAKAKTEFLLNSNMSNIHYRDHNNSMSERQNYVKQPEIAIKNSEPKDNMKRANHRRLINSENEQKLELDLKIIKMNDNQQLIKNNLYEKKDAKSLSEFNPK